MFNKSLATRFGMAAIVVLAAGSACVPPAMDNSGGRGGGNGNGSTGGGGSGGSGGGGGSTGGSGGASTSTGGAGGSASASGAGGSGSGTGGSGTGGSGTGGSATGGTAATGGSGTGGSSSGGSGTGGTSATSNDCVVTLAGELSGVAEPCVATVNYYPEGGVLVDGRANSLFTIVINQFSPGATLPGEVAAIGLNFELAGEARTGTYSWADDAIDMGGDLAYVDTDSRSFDQIDSLELDVERLEFFIETMAGGEVVRSYGVDGTLTMTLVESEAPGGMVTVSAVF
jgi:hypothetical protein